MTMPATTTPISPIQLARLMVCTPFFIMLGLMMIEAALHATTTYLVIQTGRDVAEGRFIIGDLMWILAAQSTAYIVGASSWIFAERGGLSGLRPLHAAVCPRQPAQDASCWATRTRASGWSRFSPARPSRCIST